MLEVPLQFHYKFWTDQPFTKNILQSWKITKGNTWRLLFIVGVVEAVLFIFVVAISFLVLLWYLLSILKEIMFFYSAMSSWLPNLFKSSLSFIRKWLHLSSWQKWFTIENSFPFIYTNIFLKWNIREKSSQPVALIFVNWNAASTTLSTLCQRRHSWPSNYRPSWIYFKQVENSLEGIKAAKEAGATMVMDILLTKDHQFIVDAWLHPKRLSSSE